MEANETSGNTGANELQSLQVTDGSTALVKTNGVATCDSPSSAPKEYHKENPQVSSVDKQRLDVSQVTIIDSGKTIPDTNGNPAVDSMDNKTQNTSLSTSSHEEAKKNRTPDIQINGGGEESPVNASIMGPEDEDGEDDAPLFERGSTEVVQKTKRKKKSKSKRGLVSQPPCHHARIILTLQSRKRPADLRNIMSMLHSHLPSMRKRRVSTTGKSPRAIQYGPEMLILSQFRPFSRVSPYTSLRLLGTDGL